MINMDYVVVRKCLQYSLTKTPSKSTNSDVPSPAVKRLMKEAQELSEPTEQYYAQPLEDNLFEWHFTVRGPPDSDFEGGIYHGRITLPPDYPMKPPSIMLLTPTGRFEVGTKICLSISGHHPETWQPSWSIRTVMLAIIGFMPTKGEGAIGSLDYTPQERKVLARRSQDWKCKDCDVPNRSVLPKETSKAKSEETQKEAAEIAAQISFKKEEKKSDANQDTQSPPEGVAAAQDTAPNDIPPGNPPPLNPYAMFNPAAMAMAYQGQMFPYPPNYMNPTGQQMGYNQQQMNNSQSQGGMNSNNQSNVDSNSSLTNQEGSNLQADAPPEGVSQQNAPAIPELRQRSGVRSGNEQAQTTPLIGQGQGQRLQGHRAHRGLDSGIIGPLMLMTVITIIMFCLLLRRMYLTFGYKLDLDDE